MLKEIYRLDFTRPFYKRYNCARQAELLLKSMGINGISNIPEKTGFLKPITATKAAMGDIIYSKGSLGVCMGFKTAFLTENRSVRYFKTKNCDMAWTRKEVL